MGTDPILDLAKRARTQPNAVIHDLAVMTAPDRETLLANVQTHYATEIFLHYFPDIDHAVRQLMANEFVSGKSFESEFYQHKRHPNDFGEKYESLWLRATYHRASFFSQPEMLAYVLQTVVRSNAEAAPIEKVSELFHHDATFPSRISRWGNIGKLDIWLYTCNYFEVLPAGMDVLQEGLEWLIQLGYQPPVAVEAEEYPGGYHYYDHNMCGDSQFPMKGHSVRIGMIPNRAPCTMRHELSHVILAQLDKPMRHQVETLYQHAMKADFGLIFDDEFYMHKYLHAGHPMLNDSEFFAGAMHAYTHHREELMANINAPTTPKAVKAYALATIKVLEKILKSKTK